MSVKIQKSLVVFENFKIRRFFDEKTEPIKLWLAKVGYERMQEMTDPEIALNRSREYWQRRQESTRK